MKATQQKQNRKPTDVISARVPRAVADRVRLMAAARNQSVGAYIADLIYRRDEPSRPLLTALGRLLQFAEGERWREACDAATLAELQRLVAILCKAAREELDLDC